ncbi:MAG: PepSY domain-containing protein [Verrucomicrobiae bacterium]|nr:PepSY domain-containing protein [Verrucomicrobiae bacterium]
MATSKTRLPESPPKKRIRKRLHTRLHRWLGMGSLVIVLIISVTGIALNHTASLKLDQRRVTWAPILKHYGMEPEEEPVVFKAGDRLLASWEGQVILDETIIDFAPPEGELIGAGAADDGLLVYVFPQLLLVVQEDGQIFDRLDAASLPASPIQKAGTREGRLILQTLDGENFHLRDWLEPVPDKGEDPIWFAAESSLSAPQRDRLATAFRGEGLSLSRIILDLHSGRLFGSIGVILYDLAAVCLVILGITGTMLWLRRR